MKIEHREPQSGDTESLQLEWPNLLGACLGNEGARFSDQHCDTHKGDTRIKINPCDAQIEHYIFFLADGTIDSRHPDFKVDINETLNLNVQFLKENRKAALTGTLQGIERSHAGTWSESVLEKHVVELEKPNKDGKLEEYCGVSVYWLRQRLERLRRASQPGATKPPNKP
jgi:hypothetical protein